MLAFLGPGELIAPAFHVVDEILPTTGMLHSIVDGSHQLKFPALSFGGSPILSGGELLAGLLIRLEGRQTVRHADAVAECSKLPQSVGVLVEFPPGFKRNRVDHEMGVDVRRIAVGTHLHLMTGPSLGGKLQSNFVCLRRGEFLGRTEGLGVMKKLKALGLTVGLLGSHELGKGILAVTVDPADQSAVCGRFTNFRILSTVIHDTFHGTDCLLFFLDVVDSCHCQSLRAIR